MPNNFGGVKKTSSAATATYQKSNEKHTRGVRFSSLDFVTLEKRVIAKKKNCEANHRIGVADGRDDYDDASDAARG